MADQITALIPPDERTAYLWCLVRPERRALALVLLFSLLATLLALSQPYLTKLLIDDGLLAGSLSTVWWVCALMVLAVILGTLGEAANRLLYVRLSARVLFRLREAIYRHLQRLSPTYYARVKSGDLLARLDGDVAEVQRFAVDMPLAMVNAGFALLVSVGLMLSLSPLLCVFALLLLPLEALLLRRLRPLIEQRTRDLRQNASAITAFLIETLRSMKFIQASARESDEAERLRGLNSAYLDSLQAVQIANLAATGAPRVLNAIATALVFAVGGYLTVQGRMTVGTLIAFSSYMLRALGPVQTLAGLYLGWQRVQVSLARVQEIAQVVPAVHPPERPTPLPNGAQGELHIEAVRFRYDPLGASVLEEVNLSLPAGRKLLITGASGVGKSTLIDLLQRHYDPEQGIIRLDGIDLRELDLTELRRRIVVVSQDIALFPGSIEDNLRYVCPQADAAQIERAVQAAQLDRVIAAFPQGLATLIGAGGAGLSGGQRQRLAIARAILQDPLVLILDEATSAVDTDTARRVIAEVDRLFAGRTRIVITHRPDLTSESADECMELREGRLIRCAPLSEARRA